MPLIRPAEISDCISLSDKFRRKVGALVSEDGTIDAFLATVVDEFAPDEQCVASPRPENDLFSGADKKNSFASIFVFITRIVSFIQLETGFVTIFC